MDPPLLFSESAGETDGGSVAAMEARWQFEAFREDHYQRPRTQSWTDIVADAINGCLT